MCNEEQKERGFKYIQIRDTYIFFPNFHEEEKVKTKEFNPQQLSWQRYAIFNETVNVFKAASYNSLMEHRVQY